MQIRSVGIYLGKMTFHFVALSIGQGLGQEEVLRSSYWRSRGTCRPSRLGAIY
jgi:hypothetical protein